MIVTLCCIVHPAFRGICRTFGSDRRTCVDKASRSSARASCLLLVLSLILPACSPDLNWREWRTPEVGLTQMFPCKPVRQQRRLDLGGTAVQMVLQVCDGAGATWAVAHADMVDPAAVAPALQMLTKSAHANLGASVGAAQAALVAGSTPQANAGRYRFQGKGRDGRELDEAMLVFARGTVVFQVTALSPRLVNDDVEVFLASVRVGP
jgi:hypothetical protein